MAENSLHYRYMEASRKIREHATVYLLGSGSSDEEIQACEACLGVVLPDSYKWLLKDFGYVDWIDDFDGLVPGIPPGEGSDVVNRTENVRERIYTNFPPHLIPFHGDGWGNDYCLDTAQLSGGECPVVFWNHELGEDQQPKRTHETFVDWLEEEIVFWIEMESEEGSPE